MTKRDAIVEQLTDLMSAAYKEAEDKHYDELKELILSSATELQKDENIGLFSTRLAKKISLYYLSHTKEFPKTTSELYLAVKKNAVAYDSTTAAAILLPLWL